MRILIWSGALLAIVLLAAGALALLRRHIFAGQRDQTGGFIPLHELRDMHKRGELDDVEYEQLRRASLEGWGVSTGANGNAASRASGRTENE